MRLRLKPLSEQTIVITGGSSGIGLAASSMAAEAGARVVIASRNGAELERIASEIRATGGTVEAVETDVSDRAQVLRLRDRAVERFGGFDTWVNDAAAAIYGKVEEITIEDHRQVFEAGYWGTVYGSFAAAEHLRQRGGGAIINLGSVLSERTMILQGPYSAMKHAVRGFTDALRMDLEREGAPISVTLIKPNGMDTPYPEHARNYMDAHARIPPIVYDPRLSARAILFAAENPKRDLTVGGTGLAISKLGNLFPGLMDKVMEAQGVKLQQTDDAPPPQAENNLHRPRADGRIDSEQDLNVRRTSLWLEAQMRPALATAVLSGLSALAVAALAGGGSGRERRGDFSRHRSRFHAARMRRRAAE